MEASAKGVAVAAVAISAVSYGAFHNWIWGCYYSSFPAFRASHPTPWRSWASHRLSIIRIWRFITAPLRRLPDFYIIGAPKAGSSALHDYLIKHPSILPPFMKESRFIYGACGRFISSMRYRSLFPMRFTGGRGSLVFEGDVCLSMCPEVAAAMIKQFTPNAKVIFCYREPVDRAISMYKFVTRLQGTPFYGKTFQQVYDGEILLHQSSTQAAVGQLAADLDGGKSITIPEDFSKCMLQQAFLRPGHYADIMAAFESRLGPEQCLKISFNDFKSDTPGVVRRIFRFLGVKDIELPELKQIMPEDVMDHMRVDAKSSNSDLSVQERELLQNYYREREANFQKTLVPK